MPALFYLVAQMKALLYNFFDEMQDIILGLKQNLASGT